MWLDGNIDDINNEDYRDSINKLHQPVNTFTGIDECIDFISDIKEEKVFMMVSGTLSKIIVPIIQEISQVSSVYIFCENKARYEEWAQQ
jgi:hypothetical protein